MTKEIIIDKLERLAEKDSFIREYGWFDSYILFLHDQPMSLSDNMLMVTLAHYLSFSSDNELKKEAELLLKQGPDIAKSMNFYGRWMRESFLKGSHFAILIVPTSGNRYSKLEFSYQDPFKILGQNEYDLSLAKGLLKDKGSFFVLFNYANNDGIEALTVVTISTTADVVKNSFQNIIHTMVFALLYNGLLPHLKMTQQKEEEKILTVEYRRENLWLSTNGLLVFKYRFNEKLSLNR